MGAMNVCKKIGTNQSNDEIFNRISELIDLEVVPEVKSIGSPKSTGFILCRS